MNAKCSSIDFDLQFEGPFKRLHGVTGAIPAQLDKSPSGGMKNAGFLRCYVVVPPPPLSRIKLYHLLKSELQELCLAWRSRGSGRSINLFLCLFVAETRQEEHRSCGATPPRSSFY